MAQTPCTFRQGPDACIDHTPGADVIAGQVIVMDKIVGITKRPIASGTLGAVFTMGIFRVPKVAALAIVKGDEVYWDDDASPVTGDASSGAVSKTFANGPLMGYCVVAAASGDAYVDVMLAQQPAAS